MAVTDLPVLDALRAKMKWHQARQKVLAENVANADTPGFQAREIRPLKFQSMVQSTSQVGTQLSVTNARHISDTPMAAQNAGFRREKDSDFDTTPSGNSVVLEEQMMKVAQNQMDHQAATTLYTKSIGLLRMALGRSQG